jgi:hypothetical protein
MRLTRVESEKDECLIWIYDYDKSLLQLKVVMTLVKLRYLKSCSGSDVIEITTYAIHLCQRPHREGSRIVALHEAADHTLSNTVRSSLK